MKASTTTTPGRPLGLWLGLALLGLVAIVLATACGDDEVTEAPETQTPTATAEAPETQTPTAAQETPSTETPAAATETPSAATPTAAAETPTPEPEADPEDGTTVSQLQAGAAAFEYGIGRHGGTLTVATIAEPLTFNLAIANDASSSGVLSYLFEGLTEISWLTNEVEPLLAESWEASDDGLSWTFRLREDVRWHDGTPFTAHDVEFTFNQIIYNDDIPASARPTFTFRFLDEEGAWTQAPMTVELIDTYTVRFVLPVPFAPFLRAMGMAIYPSHILEPAVRDGTFVETWDIETDPREIIGTGPFTIDLYEPGTQVVLTRNPDYWLTDDAGESLPYLDSIVQVIVPDLEAELESFLTGESDVYGVPGREFSTLQPLEFEDNFTIHRRGPGFGTTFLVFNMNPGSDPETGEPFLPPEKLRWFRTTAFRQAVSHAIDRDRIIDEVYHGLGYPQWSSISPAAGNFHNPEVRRYPHDTGEANRILDELGWVDQDGDGFREDSDGNPITFTIATNDGNTVRSEVLVRIHENLQAIGIRAEYELRDFGDLVGQLTATFDWEAIVIGLTGGPEPHNGIGVWHSSELLHMWHPNQSVPSTEWEAEIDRLYIEGSQELDRELRYEYYHRAQALAAENAPLIYTVLGERLTAVRNLFGNTTPTLYGLWDIRYLYLLDQ
ncbi:MAG: ABC transporter substrate-binding protein [Chloroflexi bacterium]|nr:ABC transporter substrate-binding protein [Chloroflexota bacterium]